MTTAAAAEVPIPSGDSDTPEPAGGSEASMEEKIEQLQSKILMLEQQLSENINSQTDDPYKLKPIDIKDIEKPDKYDHEVAKFTIWYDRFRDLLANRHSNWEYLLDAVERKGKNKIDDTGGFFQNMTGMDPSIKKSIATQAPIYMQQLKSYLRTYTGGELHARVSKTKSDGILELMRETIHKGKNRNPNRLLDLKARALSPARAAKVEDIDRILTEWKYVRREIAEEEPTYSLDDETLQTLLMKIIPDTYVKSMRDLLTQGKYVGDYHGFEQALYDEISTRKMDEDAKKGHLSINGVTHPAQDDHQKPPDHQQTEYEKVEIWSEEWQCHICGLAPRRRERSRSRSRGDEHEREQKEHKHTEEKGKSKGKGRGRPAGPCWTCGGPHLQRDCPHASAGKGNYPLTTAWSSWRPGAFPGPTPAQWNAWLPKPSKSKGKGKSKGKAKGKGDGKNHVGELQHYWGPPLGQVQQPWQYEHQSSWGSELNFNNLLPICALMPEGTESSTQHESQSSQSAWKEVKYSKRSGNETLPIDRAMKTAQCQARDPRVIMGTRFACLVDDGTDEYPELIETINEQKVNASRPRMRLAKAPKKPSQALKKKGRKKEDDEDKCDQLPSNFRCIASLNEGGCDEDFKARANMMRRECNAERASINQQHVPTNNDDKKMLINDRPVHLMPTIASVSESEWQLLSLAVDSGAAETVIPHMLVQGHPIRETDASRSGLNYVSATGDPIPNLGEQRLPLVTQEGSLRSMTFQAAPVDRALGSVKRMCKSGHRVVFDESGSYVMNKNTGEINWMREENGNYMLDMWVVPSAWLNNSAGNSHADFTRQR